MIIAIDGPAGAGKSTVAREVALALGFAYINTGAMYRAVALEARERNLDFARDLAAIVELGAQLPMRFGLGGTQLWVGERDVSGAIMTPDVGERASRVAALPSLRERVVARQREMGQISERECGGAVLEGRDIQTVVFPEAQLKVFLTATDEARAWRRARQWASQGEVADQERALLDVRGRDARDAGRDTSPLRPADDAVILESDDLSSAEVVAHIVELARARMGS